MLAKGVHGVATVENPIRLRIERNEPSDESMEGASQMCESATRALIEVLENLDGEQRALFPEPPSRQSRSAVEGLVRCLSEEAWKRGNLAGESPVSALHTEHSGWGPPLEESSGVPWLVLAADVLDFITCAMGLDDELVWEATR